MPGSNDPQTLGWLITIIVLDSIFLGMVAGITTEMSTDPTPTIYKAASTTQYIINFSQVEVNNASQFGIDISGGFFTKGIWNRTNAGPYSGGGGTGGGWQNQGYDDILYLDGLNVNGYGNYDNTYGLENPLNEDFNVYISVPTTSTILIPLNKIVVLQVRGNTFTIPGTATINERSATAAYNKASFKIRTVFNETSKHTEVYVDDTQIIAGDDLGYGTIIYVGQRHFGGLEVFGPGLTLSNLNTTATAVSQSWYGNPVTGFLLAAWNWFKTAFSFFIWDFTYPSEWQLAMNAMYLIGVRIPSYIALFIGVRLLRGTG